MTGIHNDISYTIYDLHFNVVDCLRNLSALSVLPFYASAP